MKNTFLVIAAIALVGCGDFVEDLEWCSVESERYKQTDIDCGNYTATYVICSNQEASRHGICTMADEVPELQMGHCRARDICYERK